jgi:hypothetical protein
LNSKVRVFVILDAFLKEISMETKDNPIITDITFHNGVPLLPDAEEIKKDIAAILSPEEKGISKDEKIAAACKTVIDHLCKFGNFGLLKKGAEKKNTDFGFNLETGDAYKIKKNDELLAAFTYENFGINSASPIYKYTLQAWKHACFMGKEILTANFFHYNTQGGVLHFPNDDRQTIVCEKDGIKVVSNGSSGVYINSYQFTEFDYLGQNFVIEKSIIEKSLFSNLNCPEENEQFLNSKESAFILEIFFYMIPFANAMETRPLLVIHGQKGSGKSSLLKRMGKALFGPDWNLCLIPRSRRDLETELTNNILCCFDNVDRKIQKAQRDAFAAITTGSGYRSRQLYTDSTQKSYNPRPLIAITTRDPAFRAEDDDILDRALIIRLESLTDVIPENDLVAAVINHRNEILSEMVNQMPGIIAALQEDAPSSINRAFRMADFATFAYKAAFPIFSERLNETEVAEMLDKVFGKLITSQKAYVLSNPLHFTLDMFIQSETKFPVTATSHELYKKLLKIDKIYSLGFQKTCKSVIAFGKLMTTNEKIFADRYGYSKKRGTGNKTQHTFTGMKKEELEI